MLSSVNAGFLKHLFFRFAPNDVITFRAWVNFVAVDYFAHRISFLDVEETMAKSVTIAPFLNTLSFSVRW